MRRQGLPDDEGSGSDVKVYVAHQVKMYHHECDDGNHRLEVV